MPMYMFTGDGAEGKNLTATFICEASDPDAASLALKKELLSFTKTYIGDLAGETIGLTPMDEMLLSVAPEIDMWYNTFSLTSSTSYFDPGVYN